jgi:hypothetical protein
MPTICTAARRSRRVHYRARPPRQHRCILPVPTFSKSHCGRMASMRLQLLAIQQSRRVCRAGACGITRTPSSKRSLSMSREAMPRIRSWTRVTCKRWRTGFRTTTHPCHQSCRAGRLHLVRQRARVDPVIYQPDVGDRRMRPCLVFRSRTSSGRSRTFGPASVAARIHESRIPTQ